MKVLRKHFTRSDSFPVISGKSFMIKFVLFIKHDVTKYKMGLSVVVL